MKIGLESHPVAVSGSYAESLYELLSRHAPEHEYLLDSSAQSYQGETPICSESS